MAAFSDLSVKIKGDTKDLDGALGRSTSKMGTFAGSIQKHSKAIGIAMVAMGAAIIAVGVKSVLSYAKMGDEIGKMAKKTGFSTEALSELRYVAEISGASLGSLEKATKRMNATIYDAEKGLSTSVDALKDLGLSVEDLQGLKPEEQFWVLADALSKVEDAGMKSALAQRVFGKSGTELIPLLDLESAEIDELRQKAHDLGVVFTEEATAAAESFTDSMADLKMSIEGVQYAIASALVPVIQPFIDQVTDATSSMGEFVKENETLVKAIAGGGGLMVLLGGAVLLIGKLGGAFAGIATSIGVALGPLLALIAAFAVLGTGIMLLLDCHTRWGKVNEAANEYNKLVAESQGKLTEEIVESAEAYIALREEFGNLTPEEEKQLENLKKLRPQWDEYTAAMEKHTAAMEEAKAVAKALAEETFGLTTHIGAMSEMAAVAARRLEALIAPFGYLLATKEEFEKLWGPIERYELPFMPHFEPSPIGYTPEPFQHGGIVTRPTVGLIGEAGPEAVVPLNRMGGDLHIHFDDMVILDREESINKLADRITRVQRQNQVHLFGGVRA